MGLSLLLLVGLLFASECWSIRPMVIGHRGLPARAPENTMPSFRLALEAAVDGVETDLRMTSDGVVVLMHDATVDRTTNGKGQLSNFTFAQLQTLDAGSWFGPAFVGTKVPSFEELLTFLRPTAYTVVMDLKQPGIGREIAAVVKRQRMETRVIISAWTDEDMREIAQFLNVSVRQKLGSFTGNDPEGWLDARQAAGYTSLSLRFDSLPHGFGELAASRQIPLVAWTVNEEYDVLRLEGTVSAFISDDCARVKAMLQPPLLDTLQVAAIVGAAAFVVGATLVMVFACVQRRAYLARYRELD